MINGVGSSSPGTSSVLAQGPGGKLGKDEFLKILVAQLRHQDPLNPMQGNEMAVQLAQFSSVEQLMNLNQAFQGQGALQEGMVQALNASAAMGAIGRVALVPGNQVEIPASGAASVELSVGGTGGLGTLRILDASGKVVGSRELGWVNGGRQSIELGAAAKDLPAGQYSYEVEVQTSAGDAVATTPYSAVRIDGLRYTPEGPVLTGGGLTIPFRSIVEILAGR